MNEILTASAIMGGQALFFGFVLAFAYRFLRVEEDPRVEIVESKLPNTNCGACGKPGCHAFAEAAVAGEVKPSECTVSTPEGVADIAAFLGVEAGVQQRRVARLHCAGGRSSVRRVAEYRGPASCRSAFVVNGGGRACPWGCLGLGDCDHACTFDAIHMSDEALPVVDVDLCTACGDCVDVCPVDLFSLQALDQPLLVQCRAPLTGDAARAACSVACDACGRCALDAGEGVIEMSGGLPRILRPQDATPQATLRCPTGAIQWVPGRQFEPKTVRLRVLGGWDA